MSTKAGSGAPGLVRVSAAKRGVLSGRAAASVGSLGSGVKAVEETVSNHSMTVPAETWDSYIEAVKADLEALEKEVG